MSLSTDAILCYGLNISEDFFIDNKIKPDNSWRKESGDKLIRWMDYHDQAINGIKIVRHRSDDYTMYILAINQSEVIACRGNPQKINSLSVHPEWDKLLLNFITENNIKTTGPIGWWLCSYLG